MDILGGKSGLDKSIFNNLFTINTIGSTHGSINKSTISKLMVELSITTPILKMVRDISANEIDLEHTKENEFLENKDDILMRLKDVIGIEDFVARVSQIPFTEFCIHEKVYGIDEKTGTLILEKLIYVPQEYVTYEVNKGKLNGWYILGDKNKIKITEENFIISVYGQTIQYPMGYGLFRYGVLKAFNDLNMVEGKLRAIQNKYGDVIPVFGYDPIEAESEKGRKSIEEKGKAAMIETGVKAIAIPLGGYNKSLKDGFHYISLADLDLTMHITLTEKYEDQLEKFLMGAKFSRTDSGSQAKDVVAQDEKGKMLKQIGRSVIAGLKCIIRSDAELFGYDCKLITPLLKEPLDELQKILLDKSKAELNSLKLDNSLKLSESTTTFVDSIGHLKFLGMEDKVISEMLEINIDIVTIIEPKEKVVVVTQEPQSNNGSTKGFISEFSKKKH